MARIADEEIERLKREVDLAELVVRSGVALKKAGGDLVGRCPFHDDDTPSLVVTPAKASGTAWGRARPVARSSTG